MYYEFKKTFISKVGESTCFEDVLPRNLTVVPYKYFNDSIIGYSNDTIFKEVKIKPFEMDEKMLFIAAKGRHITPKRNHKWEVDLYNALKSSLYNKWNSDVFHVVLHTSGSDSRLISTMLKELREEHGDKWLGDMIFLENGGEGFRFKEIMEAQGWERSKYMVYNDVADPGEYHRYGLQFDFMWQKFNGVCSYPYNFFYDAISHLQEDGILPTRICGVSGFGAYIENAIKRRRYEPWFKKDYYYQMNQFNRIGEWIFPWWSARYIAKLINTAEAYQRKGKRMSDILCQQSPLPIPKSTHNEVVLRGYRTVDVKLLLGLYDDYRKSWYSKHVHVIPNSHIDYNEWWGHYCAASLCEHLIESGYKLSYEVA